MGFIQTVKDLEDEKTLFFWEAVPKSLLLIFCQAPQPASAPSKEKPHPSAWTGGTVYRLLSEHTHEAVQKLDMPKWVFLSEGSETGAFWTQRDYAVQTVRPKNVREAVADGFQDGFSQGYEKVVALINETHGLDLTYIKRAFSELEGHDFVAGPTETGTSYLLGMRHPSPRILGVPDPFRDALGTLKKEDHALLPLRKIIDAPEDLKDIDAFKPLINHITL